MERNLSRCIQTDNITSLVDAKSFGYSSGETFYTTVFLPLIAFFGVVVNLAFIFVVSRVPRMHTSTNCYLINLAIADIVFLLTGVGEKLYRFVKSPIHGDDTPIQNGGCVWIYLITDTTYFVSLCFVTLVSIERFCAVCKPQNRYCISKSKAGVLACIAWMLSVCLASALITTNSKFFTICIIWPKEALYLNYPESWGLCTAFYPWVKAYGEGMQTIPFFLTLVINGIMYILIIRGLNKSVSRLKSHSERSSEIDSRMRDQITRMLIINGFIFFLCLAPFEILSFIEMLSGIQKRLLFHSDTLVGLSYSARALAYINCVINPVIYTTMSQRYRHAFKQVFSMERPSVPVTGQSCTTKYIGSTTQEHVRVNFDSRL
nr:pyrokinin-1 receptor-like [Lytechinus pictus]